jgi:hypothetical protein
MGVRGAKKAARLPYKALRGRFGGEKGWVVADAGRATPQKWWSGEKVAVG